MMIELLETIYEWIPDAGKVILFICFAIPIWLIITAIALIFLALTSLLPNPIKPKWMTDLQNRLIKELKL